MNDNTELLISFLAASCQLRIRDFGNVISTKFIFHAVGPIWRGGVAGEADLLASAYRRCLELAVEHSCRSIAFPALSTGAYGYPMDLAAERSLSAVREFLLKQQQPELVRFVLFDGGSFGAFARALEVMAEWGAYV